MLNKNIPPPSKKREINLTDGLRVFHKKFGIGVITKKLGRDVFRVNFEKHGTINIHYDYLKLA